MIRPRLSARPVLPPLGLVLALAGAVLSAHAASGAPPPETPLLHVVLFDLAPDAGAAEAEALAADCRRLLATIPGVTSVAAGAKAFDEREVHVKDYDVGLAVRLDSAAALAGYARHPRHLELVEKWRGRASYRVIDFFAEP